MCSRPHEPCAHVPTSHVLASPIRIASRYGVLVSTAFFGNIHVPLACDMLAGKRGDHGCMLKARLTFATGRPVQPHDVWEDVPDRDGLKGVKCSGSWNEVLRASGPPGQSHVLDLSEPCAHPTLSHVLTPL